MPVPSSQARTHFVGHARSFLGKSYEQKTAPWRGLQQVIEKLGDENVEVTASGCKATICAFESECNSLLNLKVAAKGWQKDNFIKSHIDGFALLVKVAQLHANILADFKVLKSVRLLEVRQLSGERRKLALAIRRHGKALMQQDFFKSALTWFGDAVLNLGSGALAPKSNVELKQGFEGKMVDKVVHVTGELREEAKMKPFLQLSEALQRECNVEKVADKVLSQFDEDGNFYCNHSVLKTENFAFKPEYVPNDVLDGHRPPAGW
eukprot:6474021-Amphidinium_carterae.1